MTEHEQRIEIAKWCGWRKIHSAEIYEWSWMNRDDKGVDELPDYLHDLNATHEAESMLSPEQLVNYKREIENRLGFTQAFRATASQRAEALLRSINLWK